MAVHKPRHTTASSLAGCFPGDRRDRRPGTHFAAELGAPSRAKRKAEPAQADERVDEDLGVSAFGIDWPFLKN
jgi:hypothetical protein